MTSVPRLDLPEFRRGEGGLRAFQRGRLLHHHAKVLFVIGGDLAIGRGKRLDRRVNVELARAGDQAVAVEAAADQHEPSHQLRSAQRDQQRDEGAVAVAGHVRRVADHALDEGDRVVRHRVEREWAGNVGRAPVTALVGRQHPEALGERTDVGVEEARVAQAAVQQDERLARAPFLVPRLREHAHRVTSLVRERRHYTQLKGCSTRKVSRDGRGRA
jgi:hypothetical protein